MKHAPISQQQLCVFFGKLHSRYPRQHLLLVPILWLKRRIAFAANSRLNSWISMQIIYLRFRSDTEGKMLLRLHCANIRREQSLYIVFWKICIQWVCQNFTNASRPKIYLKFRIPSLSTETHTARPFFVEFFRTFDSQAFSEKPHWILN